MRRSILVLTLCAIAGCGDGYLRGSVTKSQDGKTYFGVTDDNGGSCEPLMIDGAVWRHPIGEVAPIQSGEHTISCGVEAGSEISFTVPQGVVFKFDYWGP